MFIYIIYLKQLLKFVVKLDRSGKNDISLFIVSKRENPFKIIFLPSFFFNYGFSYTKNVNIFSILLYLVM